MPAPVDADKLNDCLQDMINFLARQESASYEPEDQGKYRYARNALEDLQKKVDEGEFK
jgi:hypothetical protein